MVSTPGHGRGELDGLGVVVEDGDEGVVQVDDVCVHQVDCRNVRPETFQNVVAIPGVVFKTVNFHHNLGMGPIS